MRRPGGSDVIGPRQEQKRIVISMVSWNSIRHRLSTYGYMQNAISATFAIRVLFESAMLAVLGFASR